jgi:hypothetical protein
LTQAETILYGFVMTSIRSKPPAAPKPPPAASAPRVTSAPVKPQGDLARDVFGFASHFDHVLTPYPAGAQALAKESGRLAKLLQPPIAALPANQQQVVRDVRGLGVSDADLFHGSHVVVHDGGKLYAKWSALGPTPRTSSHYPGCKTQQYEFAMQGVGGFLFGKTPAGDTFFQFEAHPNAGGFKDHLLHLADYEIHKLSGDMNVGPFGLSPHSEKTGQQLDVTP